MDKNLIQFLNSIDIPLGTTIAVIIGLITFCTGAYVGFKKFKKKYDDGIKKKLKSAESNKEFHDSVQSIASTVNTIQDTMNDFANSNKEINDSINNLKQMIEDIKIKSDETDESLENRIEKIDHKLSAMDEKTSLLIESDKEGIKSYITDKYYKSLSDGYIEPHVLETLELRYKMYLQENGNTFVSGLMKYMRELPSTKPIDKV